MLPILILLVAAAALFRSQGDDWPVIAAKLGAVVVLYLVALYVFFGVVIVSLS
jgi:hypothetical protein